MSLQALRDRFLAGSITKPEYIEQMHRLHAALFDYAAYLGGTDIASITISDGQVLMVSRQDGVKIVCDPDDRRIAPIEVLNFLDYEKVDSEMIMRLVRNGDRVFDIGANIGWYSISLAKRYPACRVEAFEPVPKTFAYLKRHIELNAASNVTLHDHGFSNKPEVLTFYYDPAGSGNASAARLVDSPSLQEIQCRVLPLDDFMAGEAGPVDFIKCDVEGAELLVFQGGVKTLAAHKPIVFSEMLRKWSAKYGYHPNDIIALFQGLGYRCFTAKGERLEPFTTVTDETLETNYFFLHADKHAARIRELAGA